jgi:hypothetical protein
MPAASAEEQILFVRRCIRQLSIEKDDVIARSSLLVNTCTDKFLHIHQYLVKRFNIVKWIKMGSYVLLANICNGGHVKALECLLSQATREDKVLILNELERMNYGIVRFALHRPADARYQTADAAHRTVHCLLLNFIRKELFGSITPEQQEQIMRLCNTAPTTVFENRLLRNYASHRQDEFDVLFKCMVANKSQRIAPLN